MDVLTRLIDEEVEKAKARPVITAQQVAGWAAMRLDYHEPELVDIVEDVLRAKYDPADPDAPVPLERYETEAGIYKRMDCMTPEELRTLGARLRRLGEADMDHADMLRAGRDRRASQGSEEFAYFGNCPVCRREPEYVNVHMTHWMICGRCKTKWRIGSNLFSSWHDETEADWERNRALLATFREVEPLRNKAT